MPLTFQLYSIAFHEIAKELRDFMQSFTPIEALRDLASHPDLDVRRKVAWNGFTPPDALRLLANDEDETVRLLVAGNVATPPDAMAHLAGDPSAYVREKLAENPATTPDVLAILATDNNELIAYRVAENPKTPTETLRMLATKHDMAHALAKNPAAPVDILITLALKNDKAVNTAILCNPGTPEYVKCMVFAFEQASDKERQNLYDALAKDLNEMTSPTTFCELLATQDNIYAIECLARYSETPSFILSRIAYRLLDKDHAKKYGPRHEVFSLLRLILDHPNTPTITRMDIRNALASTFYPMPSEA